MSYRTKERAIKSINNDSPGCTIRYRSVGRVILAALLSLSLLYSTAGAEADGPSIEPGEEFWHSHQAGLRLGAWINLGDTPPSSDSSGNFRSDVKDGNVFVEAAFGYRFSRPLLGELSLAVVNRGDVTLQDGSSQRIGNLLISSILLQMRWYPFSLRRNVHPYVFAGGGIYYGRRDVQFISLNAPYYDELNDESRTAFSYTAGAGVDWVVGKTVALELHARYLPIKFSKDLVLVRDYEAVTISFGIKYLYFK